MDKKKHRVEKEIISILNTEGFPIAQHTLFFNIEMQNTCNSQMLALTIEINISDI